MQFLHTKGKKIVDERGREVRLRGICVGGWMNLENFINGYPGTETSLREQMVRSLGEERGKQFFTYMLDSFLREEDIAFIRSFGGNCIRVALNYRHFEADETPFCYKKEGFARLHRLVSWCERQKVYVIFDMHAVQGWQNTHWHSDNDGGISLLWGDGGYQERYLALLREIARHFQDCPAVAGYELMNEPSSSCRPGDYPYNMYENFRPDYVRFNGLMKRAAKAIREIDKRHLLFIEGDGYGHNFAGMEPPWEDNLVYSAHDYVVSGFGPGKYPGHFEELHNDRVEASGYWDEEKQIQHILETEGWKFSEKYQVPLWISEFGSQYCTGEEDNVYRLASMDDQLKAMNQLGIHWTPWTYKDCGTMGLVTLKEDSEYRKRIEPVQRMKGLLGAENFTAWRSVCPGRQVTAEFTDYMLSLLTQAGSYTRETFQKCMNYKLLTGFAAGVLQPEYGAVFAGCTAKELEQIMRSFRLENCTVNAPYLAVLKKRTQDA